MHWLSLACAIAALQNGEPTPLLIAARPAERRSADIQQNAPSEVEGVDVVGRRGSAPTPPEIEFGAADIDALGAYDVGDVVARTMEALGSDAAPVVMINGRRVANPAVFFGFPPDALARVEVLPQAAVALYGSDPTRRVLNIVLQRRFESRDGLLETARPTAGGMSSQTGDLRRAAISGDRTDQAGARISRETSLRTGERDGFSEARPGADAVTLRPRSDTVAANLMLTRMLGDWSGTFGVNGRLQNSRSVFEFQGEAVESRRRMDSLVLTSGLSGEWLGWSVQLGLNGQLARVDQNGPAESTTTNDAVTASLDANRTILDLPAGSLVANLSGRASSFRSVVETPQHRTTRLSEAGELAAGVTIPLSRWTPEPDGGTPRLAAGDASVTLGANLRQGGAGGGDGLNAALSWVPLRKVRFSGGWSTSTEGVTEEQRFAPVFYGAPITVYDFRTGLSSEVLPILGGVPDLRAPSLEQISAALSVGPFTSWKVSGGVNLLRTDAADGVGLMPVATPQIEAVFPERFRRDDAGRLVSIDLRPLNLRSVATERLLSNLSFTVPLGRAGDGRAEALRVALNHTWQIRNATIVRQGLPELDRLAGDGGGASRQEFNVVLDGRRGPWGVNAAARWRDGYRIRRDIGRDGPDDLRIAAFSTIDLKLSYRIERASPPAAGGAPPRRGVGTQLEFGIDNLFDRRPSASLGDGRPAPGYGRDDQDPVGRSVRLAVKQRF